MIHRLQKSSPRTYCFRAVPTATTIRGSVQMVDARCLISSMARRRWHSLRIGMSRPDGVRRSWPRRRSWSSRKTRRLATWNGCRSTNSFHSSKNRRPITTWANSSSAHRTISITLARVCGSRRKTTRLVSHDSLHSLVCNSNRSAAMIACSRRSKSKQRMVPRQCFQTMSSSSAMDTAGHQSSRIVRVSALRCRGCDSVPKRNRRSMIC